MSSGLFVGVFVLVFGLIIRWAFKKLPHENWQIMCAIPIAKQDQGSWRGLNVTYYGLIVAGAVVIGAALIIILTGAIGVPPVMTAITLLIMLALCGPAAKILALVVERKRHTLTIGGAAFVGVLASPFAVTLTNYLVGPTFAKEIPLVPMLAAIALGYTVSEGIGRLACISFGCCYGKPLSQCSPWVRWVVGNHGFVFSGKTKKIAYENGLDGIPVVPVQAFTALLYLATGSVAMFLYLNSAFALTLVVSMVISQTWRVLSETLRADYRGRGKISAYQIMAGLAVALTLVLGTLETTKTLTEPDILLGLRSVWDPAFILGLQALWVLIFLWTGVSRVTGSTLSFRVLNDNI
jgi:hypothetical protein